MHSMLKYRLERERERGGEGEGEEEKVQREHRITGNLGAVVRMTMAVRSCHVPRDFPIVLAKN